MVTQNGAADDPMQYCVASRKWFASAALYSSNRRSVPQKSTSEACHRIYRFLVSDDGLETNVAYDDVGTMMGPPEADHKRKCLFARYERDFEKSKISSLMGKLIKNAFTYHQIPSLNAHTRIYRRVKPCPYHYRSGIA